MATGAGSPYISPQRRPLGGERAGHDEVDFATVMVMHGWSLQQRLDHRRRRARSATSRIAQARFPPAIASRSTVLASRATTARGWPAGPAARSRGCASSSATQITASATAIPGGLQPRGLQRNHAELGIVQLVDDADREARRPRRRWCDPCIKRLLRNPSRRRVTTKYVGHGAGPAHRCAPGGTGSASSPLASEGEVGGSRSRAPRQQLTSAGSASAAAPAASSRGHHQLGVLAGQSTSGPRT